jgi:hypothetical protein
LKIDGTMAYLILSGRSLPSHKRAAHFAVIAGPDGALSMIQLFLDEESRSACARRRSYKILIARLVYNVSIRFQELSFLPCHCFSSTFTFPETWIQTLVEGWRRQHNTQISGSTTDPLFSLSKAPCSVSTRQSYLTTRNSSLVFLRYFSHQERPSSMGVTLYRSTTRSKMSWIC